MAVVDTKRGNVGRCNGRSAQQESGVLLSKKQRLYRGRLNIQCISNSNTFNNHLLYEGYTLLKCVSFVLFSRVKSHF